jgi:hypothetical protein
LPPAATSQPVVNQAPCRVTKRYDNTMSELGKHIEERCVGQITGGLVVQARFNEW